MEWSAAPAIPTGMGAGACWQPSQLSPSTFTSAAGNCLSAFSSAAASPTNWRQPSSRSSPRRSWVIATCPSFPWRTRLRPSTQSPSSSTSRRALTQGKPHVHIPEDFISIRYSTVQKSLSFANKTRKHGKRYLKFKNCTRPRFSLKLPPDSEVFSDIFYFDFLCSTVRLQCNGSLCPCHIANFCI